MSFVLSAVLFLIGTTINSLSYQSIEPFWVFSFYSFLGMLIIWCCVRVGNMPYFRIFLFMFGILSITSGIAAIYANHFDDQIQLDSDASMFYDFVTKEDIDERDLAILGIAGWAGAIYTWRFFYAIFVAFGFVKLRCIGIGLNMLLVGLSAVIGLAVVRTIWRGDTLRNRLISYMYGFSGIFWLFGSIHLRDCFGLFGISLLFLFFIKALQIPKLANFVALLFVSFFAFMTFGWVIRDRFQFIPVGMFTALIAAVWAAKRVKRELNWFVVALILLGLPTIVAILSLHADKILSLRKHAESYVTLAANTSGDSSLAMMLIVNQPTLVKIPVGIFYMFVFPIPVWASFMLGQAYSLFKGFNLISMYLISPAFLLGLWRVISESKYRTVASVFSLLTFLGFSAMIASSSLETRHFGTFLLPMFIIALVPDFGCKKDKMLYLWLLWNFLICVFIAHLLLYLKLMGGVSIILVYLVVYCRSILFKFKESVA